MSHFLNNNQSIVSILLASTYLLVLGIVPKYWKKINFFAQIVFGYIVFVCIYILVLTTGRAGWIGFIMGLFFLGPRIFPLPKTAIKSGLFAMLFIPILLLLFVSLKKDSSLGRLLIYKVSANIFQNNWLWGIGLGNFKVQYNLYQANYFSGHSIDSNEALLADNTFYAFNDLWQLLIEVGTIRFAVLVTIVIIIFRHFSNYIIRLDKAHLFYGAMSGLLCITVASLFSYPFQVFSIQLTALVYSAVVLFSLTASNKHFRGSKWPLLGAKAFCCAGILILCYQGCIKILFIEKSNEAFDLARAGYKREALSTYASLQHSFIMSGPALFSYAKQLYNSNRLTEARTVLDEARKYYVDNEVYKLSASIAYEQGQLAQAEKDYRTSMYMVPNRMRSRYELFNFYLITKDTPNAITWGHSILQMPVKVPSTITQNLKKQTSHILRQVAR